MCRAGGRRCPSHTDPEAIAARNAKRRAIYAQNKQKSSGSAFEKTGDDFLDSILNMEEELFGTLPVQQKTVKKKAAPKSTTTKKTTKKNTVSSSQTFKKTDAEKSLDENLTSTRGDTVKTSGNEKLNDVFNGKEIELIIAKGDYKTRTYSPDELFRSSETIDYKEDLNLDVRENSGQLVDIGYFNKQTISGVLDYTKLADTPDTELGFKDMSGPAYDIYKIDEILSHDDYLALSRIETQDLSLDDRDALTYFTSNQYEWVNQALFQKRVKKTEDGYGKGKNFSAVTSETYSYGGQNNTNLKKITEQLDKALAKGPKQQRTLYRGIKRNAGFLKDKDGNEISAEDWVDSNLSVGGEIKFDGYQSATPKATSLSGYSTNDGIIYEIITPEGVNVESVTAFSSEYEVTLPRNARYTVASITKNVKTKLSSYGDGVDNTVVRLVAINSKGEVLDGTNSDPVEPLTDEYFDKIF